jgi:hypothetical protein
VVVFLADRDRLQSRALHKRIAKRLLDDGRFSDATVRVAGPRDPGPYRAVAATTRDQFVHSDSGATREARVEIGFRLETAAAYEHYWVNWIEPDHGLLLGWHQDDTHDELGEVHLQVGQPDGSHRRDPATFIDQHPIAVVEARLAQLPSALEEYA